MTEIGDLEYTTYNMLVNNIDIDKEKNVTSKYSFLNLENLVQSFPLDINLDGLENGLLTYKEKYGCI